MQPKNKKAKTKQVYEKPLLKIIELTAEEVLGETCWNIGFPASFSVCDPPSPQCSQ